MTAQDIAWMMERLESVPDDLIIGLVDSKDLFKPTHTQINIGEDAREAARALRALVAERDALRQRLEAAEKDAERYRWLRQLDRSLPWTNLLQTAITGSLDIDAATDAYRGERKP
jgi:hypothetical protein